jgi:hypothetical protein
MTRLRRAVGTGAVVIAALASALPAQAAARFDGTFDSLEQKSYAGGSQPVGLGNGWYVDGNIWVGSPPAAEPGSAVPSPSNSASLSQVSCVRSCQRTAGDLRTVVRTTPGRPITVRLLAAAGHAGMNAEVGVHGFAQDQPKVTGVPNYSSALPGSGITPLGAKVSGGLQWQQFVWKLQPTSAYTFVMVIPGTGADVWIDDLSLRCGS